MITYSTREAARILDVPSRRVRGFVRVGVVEPARGERNELRYTFQDLLVMRTALELLEAELPPRRVFAALRTLRGRLPEDRPLTSVRLTVEEGRIVVRDGASSWQPDSGQTLLDFHLGEVAGRIPLLDSLPERDSDTRDADDWFELADSLESSSPQMARELYRRTLELDPGHVDARVNLGRLYHEAGELREARRQYERALDANPDHSTAAYNLGVVLEDLGQPREAIDAYLKAIESDPDMADVYYNLARLYEEAGDRAAAIRHLKSYNALTRRH